jgi:hypothetical protein
MSAAYLATLAISEFDAKAPPPRTQAFWDIATHNQPPEDAEFADAIDLLNTKMPSPSVTCWQPRQLSSRGAQLTQTRLAIAHRMDGPG